MIPDPFDTSAQPQPRQMVFKDDAPGDTSDGHHTFNDLYDHRRALTAALLMTFTAVGSNSAWRSKQHHPDDSPMFEGGYFIVGADLAGVGQISYHYKLRHWDDFASIPELPHAPKWDGHTPQDVVDRLGRFTHLLASAEAVIALHEEADLG